MNGEGVVEGVGGGGGGRQEPHGGGGPLYLHLLLRLVKPGRQRTVKQVADLKELSHEIGSSHA